MRVEGNNNPLENKGFPEPIQNQLNKMVSLDKSKLSVEKSFIKEDSPYIDLVRSAAAANEIDMTKVLEAKELLASGQLESPQAFQRAADALADDGI